MKYVADALTLSRLALAVLLVGWAILDLFGIAFQLNYQYVFAIVVYGFLSDALDGYFARRWPYSESERAKIPWHKSTDASHAFDNAGDGLLYLGAVLSLIAYSGWWLAYIIPTVIITLVCMHRIEKMARERSSKTEIFDVVYGWYSGALLAVVAIALGIIAFPQYVVWVVVAAIVAIVAILVLKWDRVTTRPERRI